MGNGASGPTDVETPSAFSLWSSRFATLRDASIFLTAISYAVGWVAVATYSLKYGLGFVVVDRFSYLAVGIIPVVSIGGFVIAVVWLRRTSQRFVNTPRSS